MSTLVPEQIDLVTLSQVKSWLQMPATNTDDDNMIQFMITSFSQYVINETGRTGFRQVTQFTEIYDGNNNDQLFLDNQPIRSIISVIIGSWTVPVSSSLQTPGLYIARDGKSIIFRSGWNNYLTPPQSIYPYRFVKGRGNIQVTYTAGYDQVPADLAEACFKAVALHYRRKDWIDLAAKSLSGGGGASGTTTYHKWSLPPDIDEILDFYSRYGTS